MAEHNNIVSSILQGCKIAKELESNLENLANRPNVLANYCEEIVKIFGGAKERLLDQLKEFQEHQTNIDRGSLQEWLRSSVCSTQAMDINSIYPQTLLLGAETKDLSDHIRVTSAHENKTNMGGIEFLGSSSSSSGSMLIPGPSSSQMPRRRYIYLCILI